MTRNLFSAPRLSLINIAIISINLAILSTASAHNVENAYSPVVELSTRNSRKRNIIELDYLQPVLRRENDLSAVDIKLKSDNSQSKEINLGLVYRHNFKDKVIFGTYGYFDHRRTGNGLFVSGFTPGIELLSKYVDFRVNYYLPQNKSKKVRHNNRKQVKIQGTNIFAISGGHTYEYALRGYDIEIGGPVFGLSNKLNEKFGTKLFVAKYDFRNKHTKKLSGIRFRLEQKLGYIQLNNNAIYFTLNAETQRDKVRKRQNFIGLSAKFAFGEKIKQTGLQARMMDTIIRDVDIVVTEEKTELQISNFKDSNGREVTKIYYVANRDGEGDGTKGNPYSLEQFKQINISNAVVIVTSMDSAKGGKRISSTEYEKLKKLPEVINGKEEIYLVSTAPDKAEIIIKSDKEIIMTSADPTNIRIVPDFANQSSAIQTTFNGHYTNTTLYLASAPVVATPVAAVPNLESASLTRETGMREAAMLTSAPVLAIVSTLVAPALQAQPAAGSAPVAPLAPVLEALPAVVSVPVTPMVPMVAIVSTPVAPVLEALPAVVSAPVTPMVPMVAIVSTPVAPVLEALPAVVSVPVTPMVPMVAIVSTPVAPVLEALPAVVSAPVTPMVPMAAMGSTPVAPVLEALPAVASAVLEALPAVASAPVTPVVPWYKWQNNYDYPVMIPTVTLPATFFAQSRSASSRRYAEQKQALINPPPQIVRIEAAKIALEHAEQELETTTSNNAIILDNIRIRVIAARQELEEANIAGEIAGGMRRPIDPIYRR